jgi:hypothetical protein
MQKVCSSFLAQKTCVLMVHPVSDLLQVAVTLLQWVMS